MLNERLARTDPRYRHIATRSATQGHDGRSFMRRRQIAPAEIGVAPEDAA
jgi:hypothetical protein